MKIKLKNIPGWVYTPLTWFLKIWYMTLRKRWNGSYDPDKVVIFTSWHNRILFAALPFSRTFRNRTAAIISPSRDGQYIADIMKAFGLKAIRGSSSKKGAAAAHMARRFLKEGVNITMTPDGPRGPKYKMSKGAIHLASKSGVPIQPYALNCSNYWELKSWDNFQIAKPFSKLEICLGELIHVPENLSDDQVEEYILRIQSALDSRTVDM